jgi:hypothetical protein
MLQEIENMDLHKKSVKDVDKIKPISANMVLIYAEFALNKLQQSLDLKNIARRQKNGNE